MSKTEVKVGDVIQIEDDLFYDVIKVITDETKNAQVAYQYASHLIRKTNEELWKTINALYPELEGFTCNLNFETKKISVRYKTKGG